MRHLISGICVCLIIGLFFTDAGRAGIKGPEILRHFDEMPRVITLPDGKLMALFTTYEGPGLPAAKDFQDVRARYSTDNGDTWSEEEILFTLPK